MSEEAYKWEEEQTKLGKPVAVLHDGHNKDMVKIYLSPDNSTLRIVLNELVVLTQIKIDVEHHIIDFRRKV